MSDFVTIVSSRPPTDMFLKPERYKDETAIIHHQKHTSLHSNLEQHDDIEWLVQSTDINSDHAEIFMYKV